MAKLREFSATEHVDENYPSTYLAHGLADTYVPYSQSVCSNGERSEAKEHSLCP